jgi:hypothetical protein
MGLEPTTFCMAIVGDFRINAWFCGFHLNRITGDSGVIGPPMVPRGLFRGRVPSSWLRYRIPFFARVYVDADAGTIARPDGIDLPPGSLYNAARRAVR